MGAIPNQVQAEWKTNAEKRQKEKQRWWRKYIKQSVPHIPTWMCLGGQGAFQPFLRWWSDSAENATQKQSARVFLSRGNAYNQKSNQVNTEATLTKEELQKIPSVEPPTSITEFQCMVASLRSHYPRISYRTTDRLDLTWTLKERCLFSSHSASKSHTSS